MDARTAAALTEDHLLLDVREDHEWAAGHAPDAVHVPMDAIGARQDELPTDGRLIVCVCRSGRRSAAVTEALTDAGYRAENLEGGMLGWREAHLPMVADGDGAPTVL
jgi:rhodanese-related sulfurtransferase